MSSLRVTAPTTWLLYDGGDDSWSTMSELRYGDVLLPMDERGRRYMANAPTLPIGFTAICWPEAGLEHPMPCIVDTRHISEAGAIDEACHGRVIIVQKATRVLERPRYNARSVETMYMGVELPYTGQSECVATGAYHQVSILSSGERSVGWVSGKDVLITDCATSVCLPGGTADVVAFARRLIGDPFQWGGLTCTGWDCAGITMTVAKLFGRTVARSAGSQWRLRGAVGVKAIEYPEAGQLEPGDFLYWRVPRLGYHCAIYEGGECIIHAEGLRAHQVIRQRMSDLPYEGAQLLGVIRLWD